LKYQHFGLECPNSHVANVLRQHHKATAAAPIEKSWLNRAQYAKCLHEYEMADYIYVYSEYARQTFIENGVPAWKLRRRVITAEARFAPSIERFKSELFSIVFVGRLHVTKGLVVLLDAFSRLDEQEAELILVGGYGTNGMERYLQQKVEFDRRIKIRPGDPLSYLHRADVLVHPSFEDGPALAPLEALACGVPVVVTEDTGMKEYVVNGRNGYIVPTGDAEALVERLKIIRSRPLKATFEPFSLPPMETGD
jgi:glycosyltransferase involved in cell wall biosynthesis